MSDEDEFEDIDSTNDDAEEAVNTEEVEDETPVVESEDEAEDNGLDPELLEKNKKLFERAKKAEAELKALKAKPQAKAAPSEKQDGISAMDAMALMGAKVTEEEDINEVVDYAKFKGISVSEALKATAVKSILAEKTEQRTTAEATNTGNARRGVSKPSADTIMTNASKGKLPENPEDLADAWLESKRNNK